MTLSYTKSPKCATAPDNLTTSDKVRASFARSAVSEEFRSRDARALDQADFQDRRPDQAPRQLGDIAADVVGNVGQAALDHWLREAARAHGEDHEIALQIAREIAGMIGVPWCDVMSEQAA